MDLSAVIEIIKKFRIYIIVAVIIIALAIFIRWMASGSSSSPKEKVLNMLAQGECIPEEMATPELMAELEDWHKQEESRDNQGRRQENQELAQVRGQESQELAQVRGQESQEQEQEYRTLQEAKLTPSSGETHTSGETEELPLEYFAKLLVQKLATDAEVVASTRKDRKQYYQNLLREIYSRFNTLVPTLSEEERSRSDIFLKEIKKLIHTFEKEEKKENKQTGAGQTHIARKDLMNIINRHENLLCVIYPSLS